MNKKLNEKLLERMREFERYDDQESAHIAADKILVEIARFHGYNEIADKFEKMGKWYA